MSICPRRLAENSTRFQGEGLTGLLFKLNPLTKTLAGWGVGGVLFQLSDTISHCLEKQNIKQAIAPQNQKENSHKTHLLIFFYSFKAFFKNEVGFISKGRLGEGGCPDPPSPGGPSGAGPRCLPPPPAAPLPAPPSGQTQNKTSLVTAHVWPA